MTSVTLSYVVGTIHNMHVAGKPSLWYTTVSARRRRALTKCSSQTAPMIAIGSHPYPRQERKAVCEDRLLDHILYVMSSKRSRGDWFDRDKLGKLPFARSGSDLDVVALHRFRIYIYIYIYIHILAGY